MKKKSLSIILLTLLVAIMVTSLVACTGNPGADVGTKTEIEQGNGISESGKLQILKTDMRLMQDQLLSRIKADRIIMNNGYLDSDELVVMIALSGNSLVETYNGDFADKYKTVSEYANSENGLVQRENLEKAHEELAKSLKDKGLISDVVYSYTTVMNAIAVKTTYGKLKDIEELGAVKSVTLSETYNRPVTQSTKGGSDVSAIENIVDVYPTGIFNSGSIKDQSGNPITGLNTSVAVLDSGFDCSHSVFKNLPSEEMITREDIGKILSVTNAAKTTKGLELHRVYYNKKIPFTYDYADKDFDVFPYDSEHGTHVSGIIGGSDDVITGVAVDTQLVLMKVFPDHDEGGKTEDILAALEDAVLIGVDAINMSLGSSCGFTRAEDDSRINQVYDSIKEAGISLLTAASNSYSAAFGGEGGNTNKVTNPDSGTVGSPSTYDAALSVASISGVKSKYVVANDGYVFFFSESNAVTGKPNDFFKELGVTEGETKVYEYVTVPGVGKKINYAGINVKGKIALVRRGDNTFEDKALQAKNAGAVACIIYNNVEGDILMSMGKTDHIPTISVSKDVGEELAKKNNGTMTIAYQNQAGPFMSDFSSWGPTPSLEIKPEITAHGGDIKSAVPGGGYDELSGTSMATPNLCGIVILIRQYLKEKYPDKSMKEISALTNSMLMSTATIVLNQQGNPYSPRKQGAGLASVKNVVGTKAYLSVDGKDRPKIELKDDPTRKGEYKMAFNVINISGEAVSYDLSLVGMTESVSTSDKEYVAERPYILNDNFEMTVSGGTANGKVVTVPAGGTAKIELVYTLTADEKAMIDQNFKYGMYIEGFVKLAAKENDNVNLNVPFLAFYGDWTEAPMFDKTYYEVESEAHDKSIDDEDKLKADYFATTPYGSYYYNYLIPLGTYLYDVDESKYDAIAATESHIAISDALGSIDGIAAVYAGLLRGAKKMSFTITDKLSGEVVWSHVDENAIKSHYNGMPFPYYENLKMKSAEYGLVNNRQYEFTMQGLLDYGDGGASKNIRSSFSFDFYLDNEAPTLKSVSYEKVYDRTLKKDRYYMTMTVYDNQYAMSVTPIIFTSSSSYTFLTEKPIPIYGEQGKDSTVKFEITSLLDDIKDDKIIQSALAFSIDDYALNSNIYICQLPGTKGDFKFTKDGTMSGTDLIILSMYEDEIVNLSDYLATGDKTVDKDKDYLKNLVWKSSNELVVKVKEGVLLGMKEGKATVTVSEQMNGKQAVVIINVKKRESATASGVIGNYDDATIKSVRFNYFDTVAAFSKGAQTTEIGKAGDRKFFGDMNKISFYPGEQIKLSYDIEPWYAADKYTVTFSSSIEEVASVDQKGNVKGLKEGTTLIQLRVEKDGKLAAMATITVEIKNPFVIENRMLVAYKGLGGEVVIPDDEGILYIGAYAFCLYTTDNSIEVTEDDYDKNKTPDGNMAVTKIVVPDGVEEIQKYAFYNCSALESVVIPKSVRFIREYAFYNDVKLNSVDLENVESIGAHAFDGCKNLLSANLTKAYAVDREAFKNCASLESLNLSALRNTGDGAFRGTSGLTSVTLTGNTKLSKYMFAESGLNNVTIYNKGTVLPEYAFLNCKNLTSVTFSEDLVEIGTAAFKGCEKLNSVDFRKNVATISDFAFSGTAIESLTLPSGEVVIGNNAFDGAASLTTIVIKKDTQINALKASTFANTAVSTFTVDNGSTLYSADGGLLLDKAGTTIILAARNAAYGEYIVNAKYIKIGDGAFAGADVTKLVITNPDTIIGDYAFADCKNLTEVVLPETAGKMTIGIRSFAAAENLKTVTNLDKVTTVGDYAFAATGITNVVLAENATYGEGAFFTSKLQTVTIGKNSTFGLGAFQSCEYLTTVNMPADGNVHFGKVCFAFDTQLVDIDLSKTDAIIEDQTFFNCSSLKVANLQNVTEVGEYAFSNCKSLETVMMPVVVTIKEGAFGKTMQNGAATIFYALTLPETLKTIGDSAFLGNTGLREIEIPASVENFGKYVFTYCTGLEKVVLHENVKEIKEFCFAGCTALKTINLENVEKFGTYSFTSCAALETVNLSGAVEIAEAAFASTAVKGTADGAIVANNLKKIGDYAFQNAKTMTFTANNLEEIGIGAFQFAENLSEFVFSRAINKVGTAAFYGSLSLKTFAYYDGDEKKTNGKINDYALLDDGVLYTKMPSGKLQLASVPAAKFTKTFVIRDDAEKVDAFAGNQNVNIEKIVFPDVMKTIGANAFIGYTALKTVAFRSFTAPTLEDFYTKSASLSENDPGYEILHNQMGIFSLELYYYNFVDLVGKRKPIEMILPANADVEGYDSIVYLVYFGSVADADRSDYVAQSKHLIRFFDYATKIDKIKAITLSDEKLIDNALSAYNAINQNPADYGYDEAEWNRLVGVVKSAKAQVKAIKLANASKNVQDIQKLINELPETFKVSDLEQIKKVASRIAGLSSEDKAILDMTKYNALQSSYDEYMASVKAEIAPVKNAMSNSAAGATAAAVSILSLLAAAVGKKFTF